MPLTQRRVRTSIGRLRPGHNQMRGTDRKCECHCQYDSDNDLFSLHDNLLSARQRLIILLSSQSIKTTRRAGIDSVLFFFRCHMHSGPTLQLWLTCIKIKVSYSLFFSSVLGYRPMLMAAISPTSG